MKTLMDRPISTPQGHSAKHPGVYAAPPTQAVPNPRFRVSINRRWPGQKLGLPPAETRWARYNASFRSEEHTPESLLREVAQGYSFAAVLRDCQDLCCGTWCTTSEYTSIPGHCGRPHGYRLNRHFQSAQYIATDFDTGDERSSFGYLLQQPLIAQHGTFLYTTLSHTPQHPKARVVFITDGPFADASHYRRAKLALMGRLSWGDASIHDPSRVFYGTHPERGQTHYQGRMLPTSLVDELIEGYRAKLEAEQECRKLPRIPSSRVMGTTPAERYISAAVQAESAWLASRVEGTGERHRGLLIVAMKLASLRLSQWLPEDARSAIDLYAVLLPAAAQNGYISRYGEPAARRTIADGIAYATPRLEPGLQDSARSRLRWSGGQWVKAVSV
jgi:hypothetical protein